MPPTERGANDAANQGGLGRNPVRVLPSLLGAMSSVFAPPAQGRAAEADGHGAPAASLGFLFSPRIVLIPLDLAFFLHQLWS